MRTQIILNPIGSGGDVFPFLALGRELQRRKHHVGIMTNPIFQHDVGMAGLEFVSLGDAGDLQQVGQDNAIREAGQAWKVALRWGAIGTMRQAVNYIHDRKNRCPTLLVNSPLGFGFRIAAEAYDLCLATIILSPYTLRSVHQAPAIKPMWLSDEVPAIMKRAQYWIADRFFIDPIVQHEVNQLRSQLGLPVATRFLNKWCFSDQLCIGAFPERFAPAQPDWPDNYYSTGNFVWEREVNPKAATDLDEFFAAPSDSRYVLATAGSAGTKSTSFYSAWIDATRRLNGKLLILERNPEIVPAELPEHVLHLDYFPLSKVLGRLSAIVHTGGIGVTLQALRRQVPQIVLPMVNDQFDNAMRIEKLQAGRILEMKSLTSELAERNLAQVIRNNDLPNEPLDWPTDSINRACDLLESIFYKHS